MDDVTLGLDMDHAEASLLPAAGASPPPTNATAGQPPASPSPAPVAAPPAQEATTPSPPDKRKAMANPFAPAASLSMPAPSPPPPFAAHPPPGDEFLRVSRQCRAAKCFRLQWEVEMNPRCLLKTTLVLGKDVYLFDGFCLLCHGDPPTVPQFEYTRGGVMCKVNFVQEELPAALRGGENDLRPDEHAHETFCQSVFLLQRYLFSQLMGIQPMHMFTKIFADPARATGDPSQICGDYHVIPRFVAVNEEPLLNRQDLHAPNRMGFAVGRLLSVQKVLEYLEASTRFTVKDYFAMFDHRELVDCVVTTRINGAPGAFRVDAVNVHNTSEESAIGGTDGSQHPQKANGGGDVRTKDGSGIVVAILHRGEGAQHYDGAKSDRKIREWRKQGEFLQLSPEVDAHTLSLNMLESHLTGLRTDIFEVGTAMPMILKHIRHCNLLSSFEDSMGIRFNDKALLRQAFTHGSFVDVGMQSVNTVEATTARVRVGHLFENTASLKRSRSMAFRDDEAVSSSGGNRSSTVERDIQKVAEKHLSGDFKQEFHSRFLCPYERLEFLGDAVLSFLVASAAFLKLPEAHEGDLHQTRVDLTNNETLGQIARTANFESLLLCAFDLTKLKEEVTLKIIADCFEALLGALYKDQGIAPCRELLGKLMDMHDPELRDLCFLSTDEIVEEARKYVEIDRAAIQGAKKYSMMRLTHRRFTKRTGVDISNTHLWLQALTHPSFREPQIYADEFMCHDPNYERIEFLGDAVLQVLSSEFLVEAFPYHQEHLLTQARSSLVKNTRLAVVAREAGYEDFIRLGNLVKENGNLYVEDVLADVFEATLGAVFLENPSNLEPVRDILTRTVFPRLTEAIKRRQWMNPQKVLSHYITQWSRSRSSQIKCTFLPIAPPVPPATTDNPGGLLVRKEDAEGGGKKSSKSQNQNQQLLHAVALHVNGFQVARAAGRTIHAARDAACKRALKLYGVRLYDD